MVLGGDPHDLARPFAESVVLIQHAEHQAFCQLIQSGLLSIYLVDVLAVPLQQGDCVRVSNAND